MRFSSGAEILLTGLRKPCHQVDKFSAGLLRLAVSDTKDADVPFRIGVMGVVLAAGEILKGEGYSGGPPTRTPPVHGKSLGGDGPAKVWGHLYS